MTGFLGSTVLEVAIGVVFIYLLLATFCNTVNEWIATLLNARASNLKVAIDELLNDQTLADGQSFLHAFYTHPVITGLMKDREHPPYIAPRAFSNAVMDIATASIQGAITFADLESGIKALPPGDVRRALLAVLQNSQNDLTRAQQSIEDWFNEAMDRASGWYRSTTQVWTILTAIVITVGINADTLNIVQRLWVDPTMRATFDAKAAATAAAGAAVQTTPTLIGWTSHAFSNPGGGGWPMRIVGWILTVIAVSIGAPFWFDVLNKVVNIRGAGKSPRDAT